MPLLALFLWSAVARADVLPDQVPGDLKTAIEQKVKSDGKEYAGLCRSIDQPANVGRHCAFVLTLSPTSAEVSYGPVLSEPVAKVTFAKVDGTWTVAGSGQPSSIPADLREAIKEHVESKGHTYAGICAEIAQDGSNIGKYCANATNVTAATATVAYGPVASNTITTVSFEKRATGWLAVGAPATVVPKPPATGTGSQTGDSSDLGVSTVAGVGLLLAGVFGFLSSRRRGKGGAK
jgi:LPXTG-motif cell wall-anchored protein